MEKFNYYFNTKNRINEALSVQITKANMDSILFNLVWDVYYNISNDEDVIIDYVVKWMKQRTNIFHLSTYAKTLRSYIRRMKKMPWRDITDTVKIRKSELDYISSFNDIKKEKILFCYLAIAKFKDMSREYPTHWEDENDVTVFKMAKVPIPAKDRDYFINEIINGEPKALISLNYKNDDTSKRIDYISDDENDPVVLELDESNYYELAFTYLNWKENGGYKKCRNCGRLFRVRKNVIGKNSCGIGEQMEESLYCRKCTPTYEPEHKGKDIMDPNYNPKKINCDKCGKEVYLENYTDSRSLYCEDCRRIVHNECERKSYVPVENKVIVCVDCGKEFEVSSLASKTCRCKDCQKLADYTPMGKKIVICIDCGKEFEIDSKNNKTCRCLDCQKEFIKQYDRRRKQYAKH